MADGFREVVHQIKERADLVDIIGRVTPLKRAGVRWKGVCPFHKEKTPSFTVLPSKGIFHCFGCGTGGSVIDFVMRSERLEFIDAVRKLAGELGIVLPEVRPEERARQDEEHRAAQTIQEANAEAMTFFRGALAEGRNKLASAYLPERGLGEDLVEMFQIGTSLDSWDALKIHMMRLGFSEDLLVKADLCVRSENGRVYDRFRNRLMFPIFDQNGKVVGFGGRQLVKDEQSGKYINTGETPLFKKGNLLYGLNLASKEMERTGFAILCEGYMDVIMAHAHGLCQAVAPLGTALTPNQARLLKRFAGRVFFLYDGDNAGQNAMMRGGLPLMEAGFDARVISLPAEDDPDTFLRREGGKAMQGYMENAVEFFDFALRRQSDGLNLSSLAGQAELAERLTPVIVSFKNDVMREGAIQRLLRKLGGLPREALTRIMATQEKKRAQEGGNSPLLPPLPNERDGDSPAARHEPPVVRFDPLETNLLKLMIESPDALQLLRPKVRNEWLTDSRVEGWIAYLAFNDGFPETLIAEAEASGNLPGPREVISHVLALEMPEATDGAAAAQTLLYRLEERHQQALGAELLQMIQDGVSLEPELVQRLLHAMHQRHKSRINQAGRHLRAGDSGARHIRRTGGH